VMLLTGAYKGRPMVVHAALPDLSATHFARWLHVFRQTVETVCPPAAAAMFIAKSEMIAQALQLHIAATRGELPQAGAGSSLPVAGRQQAGEP